MNLNLYPINPLNINGGGESLKQYSIIDIRGKQSFTLAHLEDSINLTTIDEIINFICSNNNFPILLVCFSSKKAKKMAENLSI